MTAQVNWPAKWGKQADDKTVNMYIDNAVAAGLGQHSVQNKLRLAGYAIGQLRIARMWKDRAPAGHISKRGRRSNVLQFRGKGKRPATVVPLTGNVVITVSNGTVTVEVKQ